MNKFSCALFSIILSRILISCSGDNLYEFEELSGKEDYVIELTVIPEDPNEEMNFQTIFFKTDGYGELLNTSISYNVSGEFKIIRSAVKEYKKVGVTFISGGNVSRIQIKIYDILFNDDVFWQHFEEIDEKITVFYDFEMNQKEIIRD